MKYNNLKCSDTGIGTKCYGFSVLSNYYLCLYFLWDEFEYALFTERCINKYMNEAAL